MGERDLHIFSYGPSRIHIDKDIDVYERPLGGLFGLGSVLDLGFTNAPLPWAPNPPMHDGSAIKNDWNRVGEAIRTGMGGFPW